MDFVIKSYDGVKDVENSLRSLSIKSEAICKSKSSLNGQRLKHFLYMGDEGNRYIPLSERKEKFTFKSSLDSVCQLLQQENSSYVIYSVADFILNNKTICPDAAINVLVLCASSDRLQVNQTALKNLPDICIEPENLFTFVDFMKKMKSPKTAWAKNVRKAISSWYIKQNAKELSERVMRCSSRKGWKHKDLLKLSHIKPEGQHKDLLSITKYLMKGIDEFTKLSSTEIPDYVKLIRDVHDIRHAQNEQQVVELIKSSPYFNFSDVPSRLLQSSTVWCCLLDVLPMSAILKQLDRLHNLGFLKRNQSVRHKLINKLYNDATILKDPNIDPIEIYVCLKKFMKRIVEMQTKKKCDANRMNYWPKSDLKEPLYHLFYSSFKVLKPSEKRYLVAVDVRNPMTYNKVIGNTVLTPSVASALLLMMLVRRRDSSITSLAFGSKGLTNLDVNNKMKLFDITKRMQETAMGSVSLSEPISWALQKRKFYDVFIVCTDTQAYPGDLHPAEALKEYRKKMNLPNTKFVTCAMSVSNVSIAPTEEFGMLDVIGFDHNAHRVIFDFANDVLTC